MKIYLDNSGNVSTMQINRILSQPWPLPAWVFLLWGNDASKGL